MPKKDFTFAVYFIKKVMFDSPTIEIIQKILANKNYTFEKII